MANIANLITKLSGIIASLDDIRDAISQGGGGSSTASGVSVTPTSPLTGTNLQATTNETAALLQDHTDEISALNSRIDANNLPINGVVDLSPYDGATGGVFIAPSDGYVFLNSITTHSGFSSLTIMGSVYGQTTNFTHSLDNPTHDYQGTGVYVKKGMQIFCSVLASGHIARFAQLSNS